MRFLSEAESAALITEELAFAAVRAALIAATDAQSFPVVLGHGSVPMNRFTVKSGASDRLAGVKIGSYWPGNEAKRMPQHNSTALGDVLTGKAEGRRSDDEITVFDSSGIALQDLYVAEALLLKG